MIGLAILIPAALVLGLLGLAAFLWAMHSGQYDDLDGAAQRILIESDVEEDRYTAIVREAPEHPQQSAEI